uniref:KIB1-4 beta-propeller domain-containing protein n=1 Tax=Oryza punctata TaxID=4537 RepID=A0A0E0KMQ2_ORYPU
MASVRSLPDWSSGLPRELLEIIAKKLPSGEDAASFRSVCSPWRAALPFARFAPLLLLPLLFDPTSPPEAATFYSLVEEKTVVLPLPELHGKVVVGASCGWLALVDDATAVSLLNPFTGSGVALPPADQRVAASSSRSLEMAGDGDDGGGRWVVRCSSGDVSPVTLDKMREVFFSEIVLSTTPGGGGGCVAMAVLADSSEVAFCRVGHTAWTLIETNVECCVSTVVHCHGSFLAIGCLGEVSTINIAGDRATPSPARSVSSSLPEAAEMCHRSYLEVNGQLHLVGVPIRAFHGEWPFGHHAVVYKCDLTAGETPVWSMVTDAGDMAMFMSKNFNSGFGGVGVSKIKRNFIYLSEPMYGDQGDGTDHSLELVDIATGTSENIGYPTIHGSEVTNVEIAKDLSEEKQLLI